MADEKLRIVLETDGEGRVTASLGGVRRGFTQTQAAAVTLNQSLELLAKGWRVVEGGFRLASQFLGDAITKSNQQENAVKLLNAALASTGQYTSAYSTELQKLASDLQNVTTYGDETVLGVERLLVSMGAAPENIDRATKATLNLAAGLGTDLNSAALLVGKALSGDFSTLSRYGILVDANAAASDKLSQALGQIEQKFGGQAQAAAETFAGKIAQINNQWGDFLEKVGDVIKRSDFVNDALAAVAQELTGINKAAGDSEDRFASLAGDVLKSFSLRLLDTAAAAVALGSAIETATSKAAAFGSVLLNISNPTALLQSLKDLFSSTDTGADAVLARLADLRAKIESFGTDAPRELGTVSDGFKEVGTQAANAATQVDKTTGALKKVPKNTDVNLTVHQRVVGGGGAAGGGAGSALQSQIASEVANIRQPGQPVFTGESIGPNGDVIFNPGNTVGGSITGLGALGDLAKGTSQAFSNISGDVSKAVDDSQAIIDQWANKLAAEGVTIPAIVTGSGSPTLPFSDYFGSYVPSVLDTVAANAPAINFQTNLGDIIAQSDAWSKRFGDSIKPTGAFDLLAQGTAADPVQLVRAISELKDFSRTFGAFDRANSGLIKLSSIPAIGAFGQGTGPIPDAGDLKRSFDKLTTQLESQLGYIQRGAVEQGTVADNTGAIVNAIRDLTRALTSSNFVGNIAKATSQIIITTTGARPA